MTKQPEGCGVDIHGEECLCDVSLDGHDTLPYVKCLVQGMKYGEEICEIRGYTKFWDDTTIIDYLSDLVFAYDEMNSGNWAGIMEYYDTDLRGSDPLGRNASDWKTLRALSERMLSSKNRPPVAEVLKILGVTAEQLTSAITTNKYIMDKETLVRFESVILVGKPNITHIARDFGIPYNTTRNLMTYWGILPKINRRGKKQ